MSLWITHKFSDTSAPIYLKGELDQVSITKDYFVSLTKDELKQLKAKKNVSVDLSEVTRADTAGLAWLLNLVKDAKSYQLTVDFLHIPEKLLNLAELSNAKGLIKE